MALLVPPAESFQPELLERDPELNEPVLVGFLVMAIDDPALPVVEPTWQAVHHDQGVRGVRRGSQIPGDIQVVVPLAAGVIDPVLAVQIKAIALIEAAQEMESPVPGIQAEAGLEGSGLEASSLDPGLRLGKLHILLQDHIDDSRHGVGPVQQAGRAVADLDAADFREGFLPP